MIKSVIYIFGMFWDILYILRNQNLFVRYFIMIFIGSRGFIRVRIRVGEGVYFIKIIGQVVMILFGIWILKEVVFMVVEIIKFFLVLFLVRYRVFLVYFIKVCKMEIAYLINKYVKYRVNEESTLILNELDFVKILFVYFRFRNMQILLVCKIQKVINKVNK